jgi:hypothetical protein
MNDEPGQPGGSAPPPSEEEIRAAMEEEVRKLRVTDLLLQTAASVLNLSARRIGKEDERDLDQARTGIDAVKAMIPFLDEEQGRQVQQAVSELQMAYARVSQGGEFAPGAEAEGGSAEQDEEKPGGDSGLWVPPGA